MVHLSRPIIWLENILKQSFKMCWNIKAEENRSTQVFQSMYYCVLVATLFRAYDRSIVF
jgi:hypothetical protein